MKVFLQILAAMFLVGTVVGIIAANASTKPYVPEGQVEAVEAHQEKIRQAYAERQKPDHKRPIATCKTIEHHFGMMDPLTVGEYTFYIENTGNAMLTLKGGGSSCKCTLSDLKDAIVAPGETYPIKLTWNSGHSRTKFKQLATVITNDDLNEEIQLIVRGEVRSVLSAYPKSIRLGRLSPEAQASKQFMLYSQVWKDMEVVDIESSDPHFSASELKGGFDGSVAVDDEILSSSVNKTFAINFDGESPRGEVGGRIRVRVRPPAEWIESNRAAQKARDAEEAAKATVLPKIGDPPAASETNSVAENASTEEAARPPSYSFPMEDDGTVVIELAFSGRVVRRVSLYGPQIGADGIVDLAKLDHTKTDGKAWSILGRIRGKMQPEKIEVEVQGIPGLKATTSKIESEKVETSFRIRLELTEKLEPAIYNRETAGKMILRTPGMPEGDDVLVLPIHLVINDYN